MWRCVRLGTARYVDSGLAFGGGILTMKDCRQFYIDGKWVAPVVAKELAVVNPATEEKIGVISLGAAADVDKAVAAANRAFETFSETLVEERLALLKKIIEIYQARMDA